MSTVKFDTWQNTDGTENYKCRAWVNFNGTGTVAIRASGNVSSITDNGVGYYTVNFTNALLDINGSVVGQVGDDTPNTSRDFIITGRQASASSCYLSCYSPALSSSADPEWLSLTIFR
jgi:hypothetical protein